MHPTQPVGTTLVHECLTHDHIVVWDGRSEIMPPAPQWMYRLQNPGRRSMLSLGLMRLGEFDGDVIRDANIDRDGRYLVPEWKKRKTKQRKNARGVLKAAASHMGRVKDTRYKSHRRLDDSTVRQIRRAYANGEGGFKTLGKRFGISDANVNQIVHRDVYRDVAD